MVAIQTLVIVGTFADRQANLRNTIVPADVKATVEAFGTDIIAGIKKIELETTGNRHELEKHRAWMERMATDVFDVKAELEDRAKWIEQTQAYIDQATEDRWRKADALGRWADWERIWEAFKMANPALRFSP